MNTLPLLLTVSLFSAGLLTLGARGMNSHPASITTVDSPPSISRQSNRYVVRPVAPTFKGSQAKQGKTAPQAKPAAKTLPQATKAQRP